MQKITTLYDGYRFRSRTEARWAIFFNVLGIPYEYELQGFTDGTTSYLPDFYLPEEDRWVEIKGGLMAKKEMKKIEMFVESEYKYRHFSILLGSPKMITLGMEDNYTTLYEKPSQSLVEKDGNIYGIKEYVYVSALKKENILLFDSSLVPDYGMRFMNSLWVPKKGKTGYCSKKEIEQAVCIARMARFEHGEEPPSSSVLKANREKEGSV